MKTEKKLLTLFLMVFLMSLSIIGVVSSAVTINPNPMNISTTINQAKTFEISLHNSFSFSVFDFTFGELNGKGFTFPNVNLAPNQSKTIQFTVNPKQSFIDIVNNKVSFKFNASIPEEITTYKVNITENGFTPTFQAVRTGDTVVWSNKDDVFHTVQSPLFNQQILPGQTFSYTFSQIGTTNYKDPNWQEFSSFNAVIETINRTQPQKVHNPNYDFFWVTNLKLIQNATTLQLTFFDNNFTIQPTRDKGESSIRIENKGSNVAEKVVLSSSSTWVNFLENDFNIDVGKQKFVNYEIVPRVFNTEETNKTYEISITVKASNTASFTEKVKVFIPYTEVFTDITTDEGFFIWLAEVFCPANQNLLFCNPNRTVVSASEGGLRDQNITIDISAVDWKDVKNALAEQGTAVLRNANDFALINQNLKELENINKTTFEARQIQEKNKESLSTTTSVIAIMVFFTFVLMCIYFLIKNYGKKITLENRLEERYKYRNY